jgi:membrane carboxypeptidase/penicillin-binding protein
MKKMPIPVWKRRTQWLLFLLLPFALLAGYLLVVAGTAYVQTPALVASLNASDRLPLTLEAFGQERLDALLAVEDPNFHSHNGIDLQTPGAGWTTITQGLVKIHFFPGGFSPGFLRTGKIKQTVIAYVFNARVDKATQLRFARQSRPLRAISGRARLPLETP